ncbi:MAG TPA: macro domain-containing protein [Gammaproteobacteria bacterium]|nr:macro domain-containing protein [Gammaproteobacteria bacterium]
MRLCWEDRCLEVVRGDITAQDGFDAVVNAANKELAPGGGVAGAIHRAAGPGLWEECRGLGGCATGEAKISGGHDLPNPHVIHTVGPVYGQDEPAAELLAASYHNSLLRAEEAGLASVAFPALSTGAFGYPMAEAAEVAVRTLLATLPDLQSVKRVALVLRGIRDWETHRDVAARVGEEMGWAPME